MPSICGLHPSLSRHHSRYCGVEYLVWTEVVIIWTLIGIPKVVDAYVGRWYLPQKEDVGYTRGHLPQEVCIGYTRGPLAWWSERCLLIECLGRRVCELSGKIVE